MAGGLDDVTLSRTPADLAALAQALHEVSGEDDAVLRGVLVAGGDGLVLSAETPEMQVETVGAMAAVVGGIAAKLLERAGVGDSKACLIEGSSGHVAVFPMKDDMVLAVFSKDEVTTGLFNLAARGVLTRLRMALAQESTARTSVPAPSNQDSPDEDRSDPPADLP